MNNKFGYLEINKAHNIVLSAHDRKQNMLIAGIPSTGVATFFSELILQDINNKIPVIVFDPYGEVADRILMTVTNDQLERTAYFDLGNREYPLGLNIIEAASDEEKRETANSVLNLMYLLYDPGRSGIIGPRFEHAVRNAVLTVLYDDKSTFMELVRCLTDASYVDKILPRITDPVVKSYWTRQIAQTSDFHKSEVLDYIVSKFGKFITDPKMRNIVCQYGPGLNLNSVMEKNNIIIFDFSRLYGDKEAMKIIYEIIMLKLNNIITQQNGRKQELSYYIDEAEEYSDRLTDLLKNAKRYSVNVTCVSQRISDADSNMRRELLRAGTIASFRLNTIDAEYIAPEFHKNITVDQLCMLKKYYMIIKTLSDGNPMVYEQVKSEMSSYNINNQRDLAAIKENKLKEYARPVAEVEEEFRKENVSDK